MNDRIPDNDDIYIQKNNIYYTFNSYHFSTCDKEIVKLEEIINDKKTESE